MDGRVERVNQQLQEFGLPLLVEGVSVELISDLVFLPPTITT